MSDLIQGTDYTATQIQGFLEKIETLHHWSKKWKKNVFTKFVQQGTDYKSVYSHFFLHF